MRTISVRVLAEVATELDAYLEGETLDQSAAVRKPLSEEWRRERALDQLTARAITLTKAANRAKRSVWDFAQPATEPNITWGANDHVTNDLEAL